MHEPIQVDLLITGGRLVTVDNADRVIEDGALAVTDGRIVAVGTTEEVVAVHDAERRIDTAGGIVLPGFVNAHTHLAMALYRGVADDCDLQGFLERVWEREKATLSPAAVRVGATAGMAESLLAGVTTAADMYFFPTVAVDVAEELGFRLVTGQPFFDFPMPGYPSFDEALVEADRWLAADPGMMLRRAVCPHGTYTLSPDRIAEVAEVARRHDALLHVHASENRAEVADVRDRHGLSPIGVLDRAGALGPGTLVAHAVALDDDDHRLIVESGAAVAHNPASNLKLNSGIAPVTRLRTDGVTVGLGTDGPASSNALEMFTAMRLAALIHKVDRDDPTVMAAVDVVRMATIEGARALGIGNQLGSLEVGKWADLVVLDAGRVTAAPDVAPASTVAYAASPRDVRDVFVGGRQVVAGGRLVDVDEAAVAQQVRGLTPRH